MIDRRTFLLTPLAPLASARGNPYRQTPFRTILIGSGWRGGNIMRCALESGRCRVVALCDVDPAQMETAAAICPDPPRRYRDYREALHKEKPDIAIVATPDHWRPLVTIEAVKAGADVYVESPVSHTILEGAAMVKAARDAGRVVQAGLHRRVSAHNRSAMEFLKSGKAGDIGMVRAFAHNAGNASRRAPDCGPPPGMDWNMWCGPAPLRPFNEALHPRGFGRYLDYANGSLGEWGVHWMDQILWWTEERFPRKVFSTGSRCTQRDSADAPGTQVVTYEFESFTAVWEHRHSAGDNAEKTSLGAYFYGSEGTLHLDWLDGWTFYPANRNKPVLRESARLNAPDSRNIRELWAGFLGAIRNNRRPAADIDIGHRSTSMSLLGMISLKLGRSVRWDGRQIAGDAEANRLLSRAYRTPWQYPKA